MKKLLIIICLFAFNLYAYSQINLEYTYMSKYRVNIFQTNSKGIMYYQFDNTDTISNQLKIYNEDYSLYKTITINRPAGYWCEVYYMSEQLFNLDNSIEFICNFYNTTSSRVVLYNDNGTVLKDFGQFVLDRYYDFVLPIVVFTNEKGVSKLSINYESENQIKTNIYSLPGNTPLKVVEQNTSILKSAYPNPSKTFINLPYTLNVNQTSIMRIFKITGQLVEQKRIDSSFDKIILNIKSYQAGTYIYEYNGISKKFTVN